MKNIIQLWAVTIMIAVLRPVHAQPSEPPLVAVKAAAEAGDAAAQNKLADAYRSRLDDANALTWYRKAAAQGVAHSQSEVGRILIGLRQQSSREAGDAGGACGRGD